MRLQARDGGSRLSASVSLHVNGHQWVFYNNVLEVILPVGNVVLEERHKDVHGIDNN